MKFIYGQEDYLVNQEFKKIIKGQEDQVTVYEDHDSIEEILMDISTVSMFYDRKIIVLKNHDVLKDNATGEKFLKEIEDYLDTVELIFILEEEKVYKTNKLIKYLLEHAQVTFFDKVDSKSIASTIKMMVSEKGGTITNGAAIKLAAKLPNNLRIIVSEIEKLINENKNIDENMIEVSIGDYVQDDYFALANAISSSDKRWIVSAYKEKLANGDLPVQIIGQIASTLNLALVVSYMRKRGMSNQDISDELKIHIFRVKKATDLLDAASIDINDLIIALAELDKNIKMGLVDENIGLDEFILKLIK